MGTKDGLLESLTRAQACSSSKPEKPGVEWEREKEGERARVVYPFFKKNFSVLKLSAT